MGARRKYLGTMSVRTDVEVDVAEVLEDLETETLREELVRRGGAGAAADADFDLMGEVHWHLMRGQVQAAIAMIESAQNAARIADDVRQREYQMSGRA